MTEKILSDEEAKFCKRTGITPGKYLAARAMILDSEYMDPYYYLNDVERLALKIATGSGKDAAAYLIARRDSENARMREKEQEGK